MSEDINADITNDNLTIDGEVQHPRGKHTVFRTKQAMLDHILVFGVDFGKFEYVSGVGWVLEYMNKNFQ